MGHWSCGLGRRRGRRATSQKTCLERVGSVLHGPLELPATVQWRIRAIPMVKNGNGPLFVPVPGEEKPPFRPLAAPGAEPIF